MRLLVSFLILVLLAACHNRDIASFPSTRTFSITNKFFHGQIQFEQLVSTTGFKVLLKDSIDNVLDQAIFKYVPYQFDTADVDRDGKTDVLIGLTKSTEFDPQDKKRLFILRIDNGQLRPLWLGSKVCQELIDFRSLNNGIVRTIEKTKDNDYTIGNYYWQGFGLTLQNYSHIEISLNEAQHILRNLD